MQTRVGRLSEIRPVPQPNPEPANQGRDERQIGKAGGVTQFGVNHLTLQPGATTSRRHWHETEDEFVFVLSGVATLTDDNGEHRLEAGAFVGFPAGVANAHHLTNRSDAPVVLMVVGTRKVGEERVHYPDADDPGPFSLVRNVRGDRVG